MGLSDWPLTARATSLRQTLAATTSTNLLLVAPEHLRLWTKWADISSLRACAGRVNPWSPRRWRAGAGISVGAQDGKGLGAFHPQLPSSHSFFVPRVQRAAHLPESISLGQQCGRESSHRGASELVDPANSGFRKNPAKAPGMSRTWSCSTR